MAVDLPPDFVPCAYTVEMCARICEEKSQMWRRRYQEALAKQAKTVTEPAAMTFAHKAVATQILARKIREIGIGQTSWRASAMAQRRTVAMLEEQELLGSAFEAVWDAIWLPYTNPDRGATVNMTPARLVRLCAADYEDKLPVLARLEIGGVTATLTQVGDLVIYVIRGTDKPRDWLAFNFLAVPEHAQGDTCTWHRGILEYSRPVYAFAKGWLAACGKIDVVTGHSLGAGALQIVGPSLGIRSVGFASPKPLYSLVPPLYSPAPPAGAACVTLYRAVDDIVTDVPPGGRNVVAPIDLHPPRHRDPFTAHAAENYGVLLDDDQP